MPTVDALGEARLRSALDNLDTVIGAFSDAGGDPPDDAAQDSPSTGRGNMPGSPRATRRAHGLADLHRLLLEAQRLRGQLHRVTVALALTEEFAADALEHMADDGGPQADSHRVWAKHARDGAQACRRLDERLDDLLPHGVRPG